MAISTPLPAISPPVWTRPDAQVLGYRVANCTLNEAAQWSLWATQQPECRLLVTLNPEIIVQAQTNQLLHEALNHADLMVADGVGVVWAAKQSGTVLPERVPGVELVGRILEQGGESLRVYFLGAKPGIAEKAAQTARSRYGIQVAGVQHGYFQQDDISAITTAVQASGANLLLAGLGEGQERFLHEHRDTLRIPLMIGVGGTLDVLSGTVKRTPLWTRRLGLEWAYRVGLDPKRWHRFPRLLTFIKLILSSKR
jgi:N-acetylglucosaminyldiphosphoundecaprenol N-acetyl-beta-D-mannosaminyltransferase